MKRPSRPSGSRSRRRAARQTAGGLAILSTLAVIAAAGAVWRASWIVNQLLHGWAAGEVAQQSAGVYELELSAAHFDWGLGRVVVDTITIATHRSVNERRPEPMPGLSLTLHDCSISGVQFFTLIRRAGLVASSVGCGPGTLAIEVPRRPALGQVRESAQALAGVARGQAFLAFQQRLQLPSYAPRVQIEQVNFPRLALEVLLPGTASQTTRFELERLQWSMVDVVIDHLDTAAAARPLFSRRVQLTATNFSTHAAGAQGLRVGSLTTSLTDSTLEIGAAELTPGTKSVMPLARQFRHDDVEFSVGHVKARGIDFGAFVVGRGVHARSIDVDSARLDVTTDQRLPEGPRGPPHRTPQQWIADLDETLAVDTLRLRHAQIIYREHAAGRENPGVVTFARIDATARDVRHVVGRRTSADSMTLTARTYFQGVGLLDTRIALPLDAPQFGMRVRGTLGPMPATALNAFLEHTEGLRINGGQVTGVTFDIAVQNGKEVGTITPRYHDLGVSVTQKGSEGILGAGGIFGGAARSIANLAAGRMIRSNNPDGSQMPRVGQIHHTFTPRETLVGFLWPSLKDGLLSVVKK